MGFIKKEIEVNGLKELYGNPAEINGSLNNISERFNSVKAEILSYIGSSKQDLDIFDAWYNKYEEGLGSALHTHDQVGTPEYSDYTMVIFVEVAGSEEILNMMDDNGDMQALTPKTGEVYVIKNDILHGLEPVKDTVYALMLKLNV